MTELGGIFRDFFSREAEGDDGLELFGGLHIAVSAFFLILYAGVIIFRGSLREFGHFALIRRTMAAVRFANMLIHYVGRIVIGEWRLSEDLPLHICFVTNFLMMYVLATDNKRSLFAFVYYFTLIGPLPAAIFPDLSRTWGGYLFHQFIISHHVMLLFSLYCAFVLEYKTSPRHAVCAYFLGNAYVAAVSVFNRIFGTNYIMLGELPEQLYRHFPILSKLPAIVWLEMAGIIALVVAYALWITVTKRKRPPLRKRQAHNDQII